MRVIPPLAVTDATLVSHSVSETDYAAWVSGAAHALGDRRIRLATHSVYECVMAHSAVATLPENDSTRWLRVGPTNRWRGFELQSNAGTSGPSPLSFKLQPGKRMDAVALFGLKADSVRVVVRDTAAANAVVFDQTASLSTRVVRDMYEYLYAPFTFRQSTVLLQLPPIATAEVEVILTRGSGDCSYQVFVHGMAQFLGHMQYDAQSHVMPFSRYERDEFGQATLLKRKAIPKMSARLVMTKQSFALCLALREQLESVPCAWLGVEQPADGYFEGYALFGIFRGWSQKNTWVTDATADIELEGM